MQLASLPPVVAPALAGGAVLFGVSALRQALGIMRTRSTATVFLLVTLALLVGPALLLGVVVLLAAAPEQAPVVCIAAMTILGVVAFALRTSGTDPSGSAPASDSDEDGGGGQRRIDPGPRPQIPPADSGPPSGLGIPWHEFDEVRAAWGRVPAGRS
jgi:hypothetical protein